jgi:hypothetical protein
VKKPATSSKPSLETIQPLIQWDYELYPGSKVAGVSSLPKILFISKLKNELSYMLYVFMALRAKYLNGRGSGCPTHRMLEPGWVLKVIPY